MALIGGQGWWVAIPRRARGPLSLEEILLALLAGCALTIGLLFAGIAVLGRAFLIPPLLFGAAGWALFAWKASRHGLARPSRATLAYAAALVPILLTMLAGVLVNRYPLGHDSVVHCFLAERIRETGRLASDWEPWGPVPVNYPQGLHLLIAMVSLVARVDPPVAFQALQFWAGAGSLVAFALLCRRFAVSAAAGLASVYVYSLCARGGSFFSYLDWGGLPTLLSQSFFLGFLVLFVGEARTARYALAGGILLAGVGLVSHIGAVIDLTVLAAWALVALVRRSEHARLRFLVRAAVVMLAALAPFALFMSRSASSIGATGALHFVDEPPISPAAAARSLGYPLLPLLAVGLAAWLAAARGREARVRHGALLLTWLVALGGSVLLWDRLYRLGHVLLTGVSASALVPSRFLALLAYPAAIASSAWMTTGWAWGSRPRRAASIAIVALLCAAGATQNLVPVFRAPGLTEERAAFYEWINGVTPASAFILYAADLEPTWWRYYLVRRDTCNAPIPTSEAVSDPRLVEKKQICDARDIGRLMGWLSRNGKTGYLVVEAGEAARYRPGVFRSVGERDGFALLRMDVGSAGERRDPKAP